MYIRYVIPASLEFQNFQDLLMAGDPTSAKIGMNEKYDVLTS